MKGNPNNYNVNQENYPQSNPNIYIEKEDYMKAIKHFEKSLSIIKEFGEEKNNLILSKTFLYLTYKQLGRKYDEVEIYTLIKETENIEFELNYRLYQLLEDTSYLETAYNQVQENADTMEDKLKAKFLSYPIPREIVEEWEKVN